MGVKYTITYGSQSKEVTDASNNSFTLTYGSQSESISAGSGKTLACNGKLMRANVIVGSHTLACSGKIMNNNVVIASQSYEQNVTITISGNPQGEASAVINGTEYKGNATVTVPVGTTITLKVWGTLLTPGRIYVNGSQVKSGSSATYDVTVTQDSTISFSGSSAISGRLYFTG